MKVTIDGSGHIASEGDLLAGAGVISFPTNRTALPDFPTGYTVTGSAPARVLKGPAGETISIEESSGPLPAPSASSLSTIVVAATDASAPFLEGASFECDGANDEVQIDLAHAAAVAANAELVLSDGTFHWDADIAPWTTCPPGGIKVFGVIQLGALVNNGPQWQGSKNQVGGDNPIANTAAGDLALVATTDMTATPVALTAESWFVISTLAFFASRAYYNVGQWLRAIAVTAGNVTLRNPTRFAFLTADTIQIHKITPLVGLKLAFCGAGEIRASALSLIRQEVLRFSWLEDADVTVRMDGKTVAMHGVEVQECVNSHFRGIGRHFLDLNEPTHAGYEGYAFHTVGCLDCTFDVAGEDNRHTFDDSSLTRRAPSLRTRARVVARGDRAAGGSCHGGSDELWLDLTTIGCGGGAMMRGRAWRLRLTCNGVIFPAVNEYTLAGGNNQSNKHPLNIGEPNSGGTTSPAGRNFHAELVNIDITGAPAGTSIVNVDNTTPIADSTIAVGKIAGHTQQAMSLAAPTIDGLDIGGINGGRGTVVTPATNANRIIETNQTATDGNRPKRLRVRMLDFDGYGNSIVAIKGNSASTAGNLSDDIVIEKNRAYNKQAAWGAASALWRLIGGCFSTVAGAVRVQDNEARESSAAFQDQSGNVAAGMGAPGITNKGNVMSTGYDTAP